MATEPTEEKGILGVIADKTGITGLADSISNTVSDFKPQELATKAFEGIESIGESISDASSGFIKTTANVAMNLPSAAWNAKETVKQEAQEWIRDSFDKPDELTPTISKYEADYKDKESRDNAGWEQVKDIAFAVKEINLFGTEYEKKVKEGVNINDYNQKVTIFERDIQNQAEKYKTLITDSRVQRANNFMNNAAENFKLLNGKTPEQDPEGFQAYASSKLSELNPIEAQQIQNEITIKDSLEKEITAEVQRKQAELDLYLNENSIDGKGSELYKKFKEEQQETFKNNKTIQFQQKVTSDVEQDLEEQITKLDITKLGSYSGFMNLRGQLVDDASANKMQEIELYYGDLPNSKELANTAHQLNKVHEKANLKYVEILTNEINNPANKGLTELEISKKTEKLTWAALTTDEQEKFRQREGFQTAMTYLKKTKDASEKDKIDPRRLLDGLALYGNTVQVAFDKAYEKENGAPHYFNQEMRNVVYHNEGNLKKAISVFTYNPDVLASILTSSAGLSLAGKAIGKTAQALKETAKGQAMIAKIPFNIANAPGVLTFVGRNAKALTASQIYGAATDPIVDNAMLQTSTATNDAFNQISNIFFDMGAAGAAMLPGGSKYVANNIAYRFLNEDKKTAVNQMTEHLTTQGIKTTPAKVNELMKNIVDDMYPLLFNPKEFDTMIKTQGGIYDFVSSNLKQMDSAEINGMLTSKGIGLKKIIPDIFGVPKDTKNDLFKSLDTITSKEEDTKTIIQKQFVNKSMATKLDIMKDGFELGFSKGYGGVTLDKKKASANIQEYNELKKEGLGLISKIQQGISVKDVNKEEVSKNIEKLNRTLINTQKKFAYNKRGVNMVEMMLPYGSKSNQTGTFLIDLDKLEELQKGSFDEYLETGAITIKNDMTAGVHSIKSGNRIVSGVSGSNAFYVNLKKHIQEDSEFTNLATTLETKLVGIADKAEIDRDITQAIMEIMHSEKGIGKLNFLKDPRISTSEDAMKDIMEEVAKSFNVIFKNFFAKYSQEKNIISNNVAFINPHASPSSHGLYMAKAEDIMSLMRKEESYFAMSYGFFLKEGDQEFGHAMYLSLGNKSLNSNAEKNSIVEKYLSKFDEEGTSKGSMARLNKNASIFKKMMFDFGYKAGAFDITKGLSKATQVAAASDLEPIFKDGVFSIEKTRKFIQEQLQLAPSIKQEVEEIKQIEDFVINLFKGIDSGYEAISTPMVLSILYHYTNNKALIDAAMTKLDNPKFAQIMSDILLAPDVTEAIAKRLGSSTRVDPKYQVLAPQIKKSFETEFQLFRDKLIYKRDRVLAETNDIENYIKGNGSTLSDSHMASLVNKIESLNTQYANLTAQINKKSSPLLSEQLDIYNTQFLKQMSENFITTKRILQLPVDKQEELLALTKQRDTLTKEIEDKTKKFAKVKNLSEEETKVVDTLTTAVVTGKKDILEVLQREDITTDQKEIIQMASKEFQAKNKIPLSSNEIIDALDDAFNSNTNTIATRSEDLETTDNPYINNFKAFVTNNRKYFNEGLARSINKLFTGLDEVTTGPKLYQSSKSFKMFIDSLIAKNIVDGEVFFETPVFLENGKLLSPKKWTETKIQNADTQSRLLRMILTEVTSDPKTGARILTENGDETAKAIDLLLTSPNIKKIFMDTLRGIANTRPASENEIPTKVVEIVETGYDGKVYPREVLVLDKDGTVEGLLQTDDMITKKMNVAVIRELEIKDIKPPTAEENPYWIGGDNKNKVVPKSINATIRDKNYNIFKEAANATGKERLELLQQLDLSPIADDFYFKNKFNSNKLFDADYTKPTFSNELIEQRKFQAAIHPSGLDKYYNENYTFVAGFGDKTTGLQFYKAPEGIVERIAKEDYHDIQEELYGVEYSFATNMILETSPYKTFEEFKNALPKEGFITLENVRDLIYTKDKSIIDNKEVIEYGKNIIAISNQKEKKREAAQMSKTKDFGEINDPIDLYIVEQNNPDMDYYKIEAPTLLKELGIKTDTEYNLYEDLADDIMKQIKAKPEVLEEYLRTSDDPFATYYRNTYFTLDNNFNKTEFRYDDQKGKELIKTYLTNDRDDGLSYLSKNITIERLQAQGFSKKEATKLVNSKKIHEFKSHGIHDIEKDGKSLRFQAKTLFVTGDTMLMEKGGQEIPLPDNQVFIGANSAKLTEGIEKLSEGDPKYIIRNGKKLKVTGKVSGAGKGFFRNAATDVIEHKEEQSVSSSILASASPEALLMITDKMMNHIQELFKNYLSGFLKDEIKFETHSDFDKIMSILRTKAQLGYGTSAGINQAIKKFLTEVNIYIDKPKQPGVSTFLTGGTDNINKNELIMHADSHQVELIRKEVTEQIYGASKKYKDLTDEQKAIVDKNLTTVGYRYPVSSKYSVGVFRIVLHTDPKVAKETKDLGINHTILNTDTLYLMFKGDSDGDHSFFISSTGDWGDILARDVLGNPVGPNSKTFLELYGKDIPADAIIKQPVYTEDFVNFTTISKEVGKATTTAEKNPTLSSLRMGSSEAKSYVGPGTATGRTTKLTNQELGLADLAENPAYKKIIERIFGKPMTKQDILNREFMVEGFLKGTKSFYKGKTRMTLAQIASKFPNLGTGKDFAEGFGSLLNSLVDAGSSGETRMNPEWFVEFVGDAKGFVKTEQTINGKTFIDYTEQEKLEIYEDFLLILSPLSKHQGQGDFDIGLMKNLANNNDVQNDKYPLYNSLGNKNWILNWFKSSNTALFIKELADTPEDELLIKDIIFPGLKLDKKARQEESRWALQTRTNKTIAEKKDVLSEEDYKDLLQDEYMVRLYNQFKTFNKEESDLFNGENKFNNSFIDALKKEGGDNPELNDVIKFIDNIKNITSKDTTNETKIQARRDNEEIMRKLDKAKNTNLAYKLILTAAGLGDMRLLRYANNPDRETVLKKADQILKTKMQKALEGKGETAKYVEGLDLESIFMNSSPEEKNQAAKQIMAETNDEPIENIQLDEVITDTPEAKEMISLQIVKNKLEQTKVEPVLKSLDSADMEAEIAEIEVKISSINKRIDELRSGVIKEEPAPVATAIDNEGGLRVTNYTLPDLEYNLIDVDIQKARNILSGYDDLEVNLNKKISLRVVTMFQQYLPDILTTYSHLRDFTNKDSIVSDANGNFIKHYGTTLMYDKTGIGGVLKKSGLDGEYNAKIVQEIMSRSIVYDKLNKKFVVREPNEMITQKTLDKFSFPQDNVSELLQAIGNYKATVLDKVIGKINMLENSGFKIAENYKDSMATLIPDFLESHKSNSQMAFKINGFHTVEDIQDRMLQILNKPKLNYYQKFAFRIISKHLTTGKQTLFNKAIDTVMSNSKALYYSQVYGTLSWITMNGFAAALVQLLPNWMEVVAYKRGHNMDVAKRIQEEYGILESESAIKFSSGFASEVSSNNILDKMLLELNSAITGKETSPGMTMRTIQGFITNPMGITDGFIENTRKQSAIQSVLTRFGIRSAAEFDRKVKQHGDTFLANFRNQVAIDYADSGGGVISSAGIYRDTVFTHMEELFADIPVVYQIAKIVSGGVGFLSGWGYHKFATPLEHIASTALYVPNVFTQGPRQATANVIDSLVYIDSSIRMAGMVFGLYLKMNKYEKEDSNRVSLKEFQKTTNNMFTALDIMFGGRLERQQTLEMYNASGTEKLTYNAYSEFLSVARLFKQEKFIEDMYWHYSTAKDPDMFDSLQFAMKVHYTGFLRGTLSDKSNDEFQVAASASKSDLLLLGARTEEGKIMDDIFKGNMMASFKDKGLWETVKKYLTRDGISHPVVADVRMELQQAMRHDKEVSKLFAGGQLGTTTKDYNIETIYGANDTKLDLDTADKIEKAWYVIEASTLLKDDKLGTGKDDSKLTASQVKVQKLLEDALKKEGKDINYLVQKYNEKKTDFKPYLKELQAIQSKYGIPTANITAAVMAQEYSNATSKLLKGQIKSEGYANAEVSKEEYLQEKRRILLKYQTDLNGNYDFVQHALEDHANKYHPEIMDRLKSMFESEDKVSNLGFETQKVSDTLARHYSVTRNIQKDTSVARLNTPYAKALASVTNTQDGVITVNNAVFSIYRQSTLTDKEKLANIGALVHGLSKATFKLMTENDNFMTITEDSRKLLANILYSTAKSADDFDSNSATNSFNRATYNGYSPKYRGTAREGARPNFSKQFDPVRKMLEPLMQYVDKDPNKYIMDRNPYKNDVWVNPLQFPYNREQVRIGLETIYNGYISKGIIKQQAKEKEIDSFKKETINLKRPKKTKEYLAKKAPAHKVKKHLKGLNPNLELGYSTER